MPDRARRGLGHGPGVGGRIPPTRNGRIARNLALAVNFIASHPTHFYLLSSPDFVDITKIADYW